MDSNFTVQVTVTANTPTESSPIDAEKQNPVLGAAIMPNGSSSSDAMTIPRDATPPPGPKQAAPPSTPIKRGPTSFLPFSTLTLHRHSTLHIMGREMKKFMIGPMPAACFLDEFLPTSKLPRHEQFAFPPKSFQDTVASKSELDAYASFVRHNSTYTSSWSADVAK
jgi:hypothetical protein